MTSLQKMTVNRSKRNLATAFAVCLSFAASALLPPAHAMPDAASVHSVDPLSRIGGATELHIPGKPLELAEQHRGVVWAVQIVVATEGGHDFGTETLRAVDGWLTDFSVGTALKHPNATVGIRG